MKLYSMTSGEILPDSESAKDTYIDPENGEILYSVRDDEANTALFEKKYLNTTLQEVMS